MTSKLLRSVIMGAPASGKGTISNRIIKYFDVKHLASGDLLRNQIREETELGKKAKSYVENGKLVPDELMVNLIATELNQLSNHNWLLDGFPRTRNQAAELFQKQPVEIAFNLVVPFDIIIKRVEGRWIHEKSGRIYNTDFNPPKVKGKDDVTGEPLIQRPDDTPDAVKKRLEIYSTTAKPVLEYFREIGILQEFHGKTSDEIWPQVYKFLANRIKPVKSL